MAGTGGANKPAQPHHRPHVATAEGANIKQIVIVGVIVAVFGGGGLWYLNRKGEDNKLNTLFKSQDVRHINTSNGQMGDVTLGDGSALSIAPATKLTIIPDYNKAYRGIQVEGGLKIDVKPSPNTPLELRVGGAALVLNEGSVIARAYPDENDGYIRVVSGSGEVRAKDVHRPVTGPVTVRVAKDSTIADADQATADAALAFADKKVVLNNVPLKDVLPLLLKYYGLNPDVPDKALLDRPVTMEGTLGGSNKEAIAALEKAASVKFTYEGTNPKPILKDNPAAGGKKK
ncbi:MAG TPA: FecR domain-containing protein [Gemmatimonadaceae bacterium]|nr:FecR domain-containing protein [Gemmatimonadaceae bacterium]